MSKPKMYSPWLMRLIQCVLLGAALGLWEMRASQSNTFRFFFSKPSQIITRTWNWLASGELYRNAGETLAETLMGFLGGVLVGLVLALLCYYSTFCYQLLIPYLDVFNAMPRVVFGPLFILWFGLGMTSKAVLAASLVVCIVFFATLSGLKEVDETIIHRVMLMGGTKWHLLIHVMLPSALSWVFSSLRSSVGFALAGAVVGEYLGASRGIGFQIAKAEGFLDSTGVFSGLLVLAIMVMIMNVGLQQLERRLTPWKLHA